MPEIQPNNSSINTIADKPLTSYEQSQNQSQPQQTVCVSAPYTSQIYQYPEASVYNDPNKKAASGVNIYIYNPSAISGQNASSIPSPVITQPTNTTEPMAASNLSSDDYKTVLSDVSNTSYQKADPAREKTRRIVELTDDYIKTLESYLRSPDKTVRESGIIELVKRYEEDITRYDDEALTALLNIALQDSSADNRLLAMSVLEGGGAHGDEKTIELLKNLESSTKLYGQEAKAASDALLKIAADETKIVRDFSSENKK